MLSKPFKRFFSKNVAHIWFQRDTSDTRAPPLSRFYVPSNATDDLHLPTTTRHSSDLYPGGVDVSLYKKELELKELQHKGDTQQVEASAQGTHKDNSGVGGSGTGGSNKVKFCRKSIKKSTGSISTNHFQYRNRNR